MSGVPIRPATVADADAIAALHAASWRSAYRGIFKDEHARPVARWRASGALAGKLGAMAPNDTVLIAGDVGFIAVWAKGDPGFGAYIDNLHVRPDRRSGGLGRRLLGAAMQRVAARGERRAYLWVFDDNTRAIDFYRRLGGEIVERGLDEIDGQPGRAQPHRLA